MEVLRRLVLCVMWLIVGKHRGWKVVGALNLVGGAGQAQMAVIIYLKSNMKLNEILRLEDLPKLKDVP